MFKLLRKELNKPLSAQAYAAFGLLLFTLKFAMDRALLNAAYHAHWGVFDYWRAQRWLMPLDRSEWKLGLILFLADAVFFLGIGVLLTIRRLRAVGRSPLFSLLFFLPFLNVVFFAVLIALPDKVRSAARQSWADKNIPATKIGSISAAILLVVPPAILLIWITTSTYASYGGGLFLGIPFALGFLSVTIYNWQTPRSFGESLGVACLSVICAGCCLLTLGIEGAICLLMALVIALPLAFLGGLLAYAVIGLRETRTVIAGSLLLFLPIYAPQENKFHHGPETFEVHSSVEIVAPPERVWEHVVAFSEISEEPHSLLLRTGIAYPIHATISGHGVGAVRQCVFTTGAFEEPIDIWDAPHRLHFGVAKQPPVMREFSWLPNLQPEHIKREYLRSREGQFVLTQLPNGRTRLEGTTWYELQYWPSSYWHLWSDAIIHRIHMRVLEHIKQEVESSNS